MRTFLFYSTIIVILTSVAAMTGVFIQILRQGVKKKGAIYGTYVGIIFAILAIFLQWLLYGRDFSFLQPLALPFLTELNGLIVALLGTFVVMLVMTALYGLMRLADRSDESNSSRREFFKKTAVVVPTALGVTGSVRAFQGNKEIQLRQLELTLKDRPAPLKGYTIAQLSDIHIGPFISVEDLKEMVHMAAQTKAHRLVITGDLIDDLAYLDEVADYLDSRVKDFPHGIDYILGNHEYRFDAELVWQRLSQTKMHMYRNSHRKILDGERPVYMVGVDYNFEDDVKGYNQKFLDEAMKDMPKEAYPILLAHHPNFIVEAFRRNIPLTLSGHTHGGQINIGDFSLVPVYKPYWKGLYEESGLFGYVSRGSGHWFPVRMNCAREITLFTIN